MTFHGGADQSVAAIRDLIARQPVPPGEGTGLLRRVCRAATQALSASGAGISVITEDGVRGIGAASDPVSERVEDLQFVLGEGPCLDAFNARRPVLVADLSDHAMRRWPVYAPTVRDDGIHAVFAFPLQIGAARLGVMDIFRGRIGPLTGDEVTTALTFADLAVESLLDQHDRDKRRDGLEMDAGQRAQLFQAQGMVMVQLGVSLNEAMVRLRTYAHTENRRLDDVARDVVDRTLRFGPDHQ